MLYRIFERSQCSVGFPQSTEPIAIRGGSFQPHTGTGQPVDFACAKLAFSRLLALTREFERRLSLIQFPQCRPIIGKSSFHLSDSARLRA